MKRLFFALIASTSLLFISCSKDSNNDQTDYPYVPNSSSLLIKKITSVEEVSKSTYITLFKYDEKKRVDTMEFYTDANTEPNAYQVYTYNTDGTIQKFEYFEGGVLNDKELYTYTDNHVEGIYSYLESETWYEDEKEVLYYNTTGLVDSVVYYNNNISKTTTWNEDSYYSYAWDNNNLVSETHYYNNNEVLKHSKRFTNPFESKRFLPRASKASSSISLCHNSVYEFNTKLNPFWVQSINSVCSPDGQFVFSKNLPTSVITTWPEYPDESGNTTYTYEYNTKNYPTKISIVYTYIVGEESYEEGSDEYTIEYY